MKVETLGFDEFSRLTTEWDELVEATPLPNPFLCHGWVRTWWKHFGGDQVFLGPVVREGGRLLAAVPLAVRRAGPPGRRFTIAEIAGTGPLPTRGMGLTDKADLLVRPGDGAAGERLCAEMVGLLADVDLLHLKGLDSASPTGGWMAQAPSGRGSIRALPRSVSPYLPLTSTWEDYLGSRSQRFRKQLKRARRKLSEMGQAAVTRLLPADDCAQWMAEVIAINERSWKARRGTDLLRHPALKGFFLDLVAELAPQGHIDLHVLRLDGRAVAYELGFDFGSRIFAYNAGYLQELAPLSPGNVVTAAVIESACARGRVEYDMLRGDEDYKLRFGDRLRSESELLVPAERWPARAYALVGPYLKARLRGSRWLKELDDRLTGLRSRLRHRGRGSPRQACGPRS